jgi:hypothetical protein
VFIQPIFESHTCFFDSVLPEFKIPIIGCFFRSFLKFLQKAPGIPALFIQFKLETEDFRVVLLEHETDKLVRELFFRPHQVKTVKIVPKAPRVPITD